MFICAPISKLFNLHSECFNCPLKNLKYNVWFSFQGLKAEFSSECPRWVAQYHNGVWRSWPSTVICFCNLQ